MSDMNWWEFQVAMFVDGGVWILLVAAWLVLSFVLGVVVIIVSLLKEEYDYYRWRKSVEASHTAAKNRADAKKEVDSGNSSNDNRVNRDSGRVVSNAPLN